MCDCQNLNYLPYLIKAAHKDFVLSSFVFSLLLFRYFNNITIFTIIQEINTYAAPVVFYFILFFFLQE